MLRCPEKGKVIVWAGFSSRSQYVWEGTLLVAVFNLICAPNTEGEKGDKLSEMELLYAGSYLPHSDQ